MFFNSIEYFLFFPIVFFLYWFIGGKNIKYQNLFLLISSYFFYGWWSLNFLSILILSTFIDFSLAFAINKNNRLKAKLYLCLSISINIGILAFFKYYNFFIEEIKTQFLNLGITNNLSVLKIVIPVGISFYTFHGVSYIFDVYRRKIEPIKNIVDYSIFVSFFPLLVAGPIERANHLLPQIQKNRKFNYTQAVEGCYLIIWGLFKKMIIADNLAFYVNNTFETYQNFTALSLIFAAIAFSFQIYCDFSGYSDIALGSAKLLGFELLSNFKFPYFSKNMMDFWRRWHISLSSWFRDYLYIPLGGSRGTKLQTIRNISVVFILSGFWHGANWTFIFWGILHAMFYILFISLEKKIIIPDYYPKLKSLIQMIITFVFITITWIFFRSTSIRDAFFFLRSILANIYQNPKALFNGEGLTNMEVFWYIIPFVIIDWSIRHDERKINSFIFKKIIYFLIFSIIIKLISLNNPAFIYFQF